MPTPTPAIVPARKANAKPAAGPTAAEKRAEAEKAAFDAAVAAAVAAELAKRPAPKESGYRTYATKSVPSAMQEFSKWIAREFPEFGIETDETGHPSETVQRIVTVASKAYKYFQSSEINLARRA